MDRGSERRRDRRIPLGCKVGIKAHGMVEPVVGTCQELSVGGMTLHSTYVPRVEEVLDVVVVAHESGAMFEPLHARVRVRRCHALADGRRYAMGVEIVEILK
ncbi:MAG: PilZ domain-containing protein [Zoogloea sp.]|nr:PilZ domain-containing protein [Zoogloea sp.]